MNIEELMIENLLCWRNGDKPYLLGEVRSLSYTEVHMNFFRKEDLPYWTPCFPIDLHPIETTASMLYSLGFSDAVDNGYRIDGIYLSNKFIYNSTEMKYIHWVQNLVYLLAGKKLNTKKFILDHGVHNESLTHELNSPRMEVAPNLLNKKYELIATWPDCPFEIGEVIAQDKILFKISDYPHLFREV